MNKFIDVSSNFISIDVWRSWYNDGPYYINDFCDSDSSVNIKLIAFWSGAVSLIITIIGFCFSLLVLLVHTCLRENPKVFILISCYNCIVCIIFANLRLLYFPDFTLKQFKLFFSDSFDNTFEKISYFFCIELILMFKALIIWSWILLAAAQSDFSLKIAILFW